MSASLQAAFDGLRVADLSSRLSAAFAGRLFGDYGADVVLAEPTPGHPLRAEPPFLGGRPGAERSVLHAYANWNKRSFRPADRRELADLIGWADLLITSDSPVNVDLSSLRTDVVHLSITAHGLEGALSRVRGNNLSASARSGWAYINAYADEPPLQMPSRQAGYVGGLAGFAAAGAALWRRGAESEAELVDVSELEALAITCHPWGIAGIYEARPYSHGPAGGRQRGEPGPLFQARDGKINFGFGDWHNWPQAMALLNLPEQGVREDLIPHGGRYGRDLSEVLAGATRELPQIDRWPLFHALAQLRCISGCLQSIDQLLENDQLKARSFFVGAALENHSVRTSGAPGLIDPPIWSLRRPAPRLGDHDAEVRREIRQAASPEPPPALPRSGGSAGPLDGVRVLTFTQAWSGTMATQLLAMLGADVVQIEALQRPDIWRTVRPAVPRAVADDRRRQHPLNTQGLFNAVNLNKRGITLNLNEAAGRELFWQLAPRFEIIAENFRPGVLEQWGITLETLSAVNRSVILASISGYGATGPYSSYPANGATTEPMSGFSSLHGYEGDDGMNSAGLYPDPISGYTLAGAMIAALHRRERIKGPQRLDISMIEATTIVCGDAVTEYEATGRVPRPLGNRDRRHAPHNIYPTQGGGWLAIAVESDADWRALAAAIGRPDLVNNPNYAAAESRKAREDELDEQLAAWTQKRSAADAEAILLRAGLIAARVASYGDLYGEPQDDRPSGLREGFVQLVEHPEVGPSRLAGAPWRLSGPVDAELRPSPCLGEHSQQVLAGELGISTTQYAALAAARISGTLNDRSAVDERNFDGST